MQTPKPKLDSADAVFEAQALVEHLIAERFASGMPRSEAYKAGLRSVLQLKFLQLPLGDFPHPIPSAEADAHLAGNKDGFSLWRTHTVVA